MKLSKKDGAEQPTSKAARHKGKDYFFDQIHFFMELVNVSRKLREIFGETERYKPQLDEYLKELDPFIKSGTALLPHSHNVNHRIIRLCLDDTFPIPTYGRVLYYLVSEAIPVPVNCSRGVSSELINIRTEVGDSYSGEENAAEERSDEGSFDEHSIYTYIYLY